MRRKNDISVGRRARGRVELDDSVNMELANFSGVERMKRAARRAAQIASPSAGTIIFEYEDRKSDNVSNNGGFPVPPPKPWAKQSPKPKETEDDTDGSTTNALTSLLGYSVEDSPTREPANGEGKSADMDKELASFMEELESSGLLGDEETNGDTEKKEGEESEVAREGVSEKQTTETDEQSDEAAEQKVLGELEDASDWSRVLDTGSGKIYFWNSKTNEVAWEPPKPATASPLEPSELQTDTVSHTEKAENVFESEENRENGDGGDGEVVVEENEAVVVEHWGSEGEQEAGKKLEEGAGNLVSVGGEDESDSDMEIEDGELGGGLVPYGDSKETEDLEIGEKDASGSSTSVKDEEVGPEKDESPLQAENDELKLSVENAGNEKLLPGRSVEAAVQEEGVEEGEIPEVPETEFLADDMEARQKAWSKMTDTIKMVKDACGDWYSSVPEVVKKAIVAEHCMEEWVFMTSQLHKSCEVSGNQLRHFWASYQKHLNDAMDSIVEGLPAAVAELHNGYANGHHQYGSTTGAHDWMLSGYVQDWSQYSSNGTVTHEEAPPLPPNAPPPPADEAAPPPPPPDNVGVDVDPGPGIDCTENTDMEMDMTGDAAGVAASVSIPKSSEEGSGVQSYAQAADYEGLNSTNGWHDFVPSTTDAVPSTTMGNDASTSGVHDLQESEGVDRKRKVEKVANVGIGLVGKRKKVSKVSKTMSKLMNKWQAVKKQEEEDEKSDDELDPEALEQRKQAQLEQWRLDQLRTGGAEHNANFQPLKGDWRQRVQKAKKKVKGDESKAESPPNTESMTDPDALSQCLPEGWKALVDATSGEVYYGNIHTRETTWDRPQS